MKDQHIRILDYILHIALFSMAFMVIGYYLPRIYLTYFDQRKFLEIITPVTVEKKENLKCAYIDVYFQRKALAPIVGNSVKKLNLVREDGKKVRVETTVNYIQIQPTEDVQLMIAHWKLPCDIDNGTYFYEGTVEYKVNDITKYTTFYTENFNIVATDSSRLE